MPDPPIARILRSAVTIVTIAALLVAAAALALASTGPMIGGGHIAVGLSLVTAAYAAFEWRRVFRRRRSLLPLPFVLVIVCAGVLVSAVRVVGDTQSRKRSATTGLIPELEPSPTRPPSR